MKLVHCELTSALIDEGTTCMEWIIESPKLMAKYVQELLRQKNGKEGRFVMSIRGKIVEISKNMEMIMNPFAVDINDKKILNKLYGYLNELAMSGEFYLQTQSLIQKIQEYLLELEQGTRYMLSVDEEMDLLMLFKAAGIRHEVYENDFIQGLNRYVSIICDVLRVQLIVFVNLRSYLGDEQIQELIHEAMYQHVKILLIENQERNSIMDLKKYIIDKDQCEIY